MIPTPDPSDPLKVRRVLCFILATWAICPFPIIMAFMVYFGLDKGFAKDLLIFVTTAVAGPVGAYLWAAQSKQNKDNKDVAA